MPARVRRRPAPLGRRSRRSPRWSCGSRSGAARTLLATVVIPVAVLVFFANLGDRARWGPGPRRRLPAARARSPSRSSRRASSTSASRPRYDRSLRRAQAARWRRRCHAAELIAAKLGAVLVVEVVQVALLVAVAVARPRLVAGRPTDLARRASSCDGLLGTLAFAGLGLLLAGTPAGRGDARRRQRPVRRDLVLGGIVVPVDHLPVPLATLAAALPAAALADALRVALRAPAATRRAARGAGGLGRRHRPLATRTGRARGSVDATGCGEGIRTPDLRVMSPTSCRCSTPRPRILAGNVNFWQFDAPRPACRHGSQRLRPCVAPRAWRLQRGASPGRRDRRPRGSGRAAGRRRPSRRRTADQGSTRP